jgi:hypothetical protein
MTLEQAAEAAEGMHPHEHPEGDTWEVILPLVFKQFNVKFEPFAGILLVEITHSDGSHGYAIGMEFHNVIFWMDTSGAIFFGNINRSAGTMSGVVFGRQGGSIWFGEKL